MRRRSLRPPFFRGALRAAFCTFAGVLAGSFPAAAQPTDTALPAEVQAAIALLDAGDYARADSAARAAVASLEARGDNSRALGNALSVHADILLRLNRLAAADSAAARLIAIRERTLAADHPGLVIARVQQARVWKELGRLEPAEAELRQALPVLEARYGPDHPDVVDVASELASVLYRLGDLPASVPLRRRVLQAQERRYGPRSLQVAEALNNLAIVYLGMNQPGTAQPLLRQAREIYEEILGPEHRQVATVLMNLASVESAFGGMMADARAANLMRHAIAIVDSSGAGPAERAKFMAAYGAVLIPAGNLEWGIVVMEEAISLYEQALGPDHPALALPLSHLAAAYSVDGQPARAVLLRRRALALQEAAFGRESPAYARALQGLAHTQWHLGQLDSAVTNLTLAGDLLERDLTYVLAYGSEGEKYALLEGPEYASNHVFNLHLWARPDDPAAARAALAAVLRRKGRALDATAESLDALRARMDPADRARFDELAGVRARWARLALAGPDGEGADAYRDRVDALAQRADQLEVEIGERTAALGLRLRPVTLDAVQARIPRGAALIEIVTYDRWETSADSVRRNWGDPAHYAAYVLHASGPPVGVELGPAAEVDSAVTRLRRALADPLGTDALQRARELDARVMAPLRPLLAGDTLLLIAPDRSLNLVPFGALVDERGRYLLQDATVVYLTSGRDLLRLDARAAPVGPPLIVAAPAYGQAAGGGGRFKPLDAAREEATLLHNVLPGAQVLTDTAATEAAVKAVRGPRVLHVATHGWFEPFSTSSGVLSFALLRAGLALAGANAGGMGDGQDGVLTALEAAGLDLLGTRLVVLSACETGLGDVRGNDGVYGLRRALLLAGAESQVMTLWRVDNRATRDAMVRYYERLRDGEGRAQALRQVQLEMLDSQARRHPYFWAAFVSAGDWRPLPESTP
jgi:CHAT domain-containing protein